MYTSLMLLALTGAGLHAEAIPETPLWMGDYRLACQEVQRQRKPLAVFLASGSEGWDKVSKDGELGKDARTLLRTRYVCLFIDTSTQKGKELASLFEIPEGRGMVLSDRNGEKQAFWHSGSLTREDLEHYLRKYADSEQPPLVTETMTVPGTSHVHMVSSSQSVPLSYPSPSVPVYSSSPVYARSFATPVSSSRNC